MNLFRKLIKAYINSYEEYAKLVINQYNYRHRN